MKNTQKKLEYLIKFLIGATFFVPLIIIPASYIFPFIVPKIVWFRSLTLLILGVYILLLSSDWAKYRVKFTSVNILVALFFTSFAISTFVGVDWYRSFWDNHERMLGLFTIFHYVVYYFIITSVVKEWKDWKWLLRIFLGFGSVVMFIGFLQKYVYPELLLNRGGGRVSATLGNAIYFSGYGLFLMFVGFLLAIKEGNKKENFWFWFAVIGGLLGLFGIFWGGTRGALLGLFAGLAVLVISYSLRLKEYKKVRQGLGAIIILGIITLSTLFIFRQNDFVKNIPAVGRLVNTEISSTNTRVMAWGVAIDAWQEKPVFGWGPNNYYYAFNKYYRPEFLEYGWGETWFDNAHSVVMNTLAVQGGFGVIAYLGIFIVALIMLSRSYKKGDIDIHLVSIGSAFLVAHLVSLVTVFDNPTSYLYFFFFLALVNSQVIPAEGCPEGTSYEVQVKKDNLKSLSVGVVGLVFALIMLLIYSTNINPARANQKALNVIKTLSSGQTIIDLYGDAVETPTPHIDDIRNDIARISINTIFQMSEDNINTEAMELFELARTELKKNLELHPLDIRVNIQLAQLNNVGAQIKKDISLLFETDKILEDALEKSPKRQQLQYTLSNVKMQIQRPELAIQLIQDSIDNDPKIAEGWWRLASIYYTIDQIDKAKSVILEAQQKGIVFTEQGKNVADKILGVTSTK